MTEWPDEAERERRAEAKARYEAGMKTWREERHLHELKGWWEAQRELTQALSDAARRLGCTMTEDA